MVTGVGTQPTAADYSYQQMLESANSVHNSDLRNAGTTQAPALDELQQTLRATNADPSTGAPADPSTSSTTASTGSSTNWINEITPFANAISSFFPQAAPMIETGMKVLGAFANLFGGDNEGSSTSSNNGGSPNFGDIASTAINLFG